MTKKRHKLPLCCRVCGEVTLSKLVKDPNYEEGVTRLCKACQAARLRAYRKGEPIPNFVGNVSASGPHCRFCSTQDETQLVKAANGKYGYAYHCRSCWQAQHRKQRHETIRQRELKCLDCGTRDTARLIPNPRALLGYSRICRYCKAIKANQPPNPPKPLVCNVCQSTRNLLVRNGKRIRLCRFCKSAEVTMTRAAQRLRQERLQAALP